jgi:hypothetical protein
MDLLDTPQNEKRLRILTETGFLVLDDGYVVGTERLKLVH